MATAHDLRELLRRVAATDRVAFAELYGLTSAKLYGIVLRILRRRGLADEVVQDVYVKVWERAGDFDPTRGSPIAWLATIARNRALDEVRRRPELPLEETPEAMAVADAARSPAEAAELSDDFRRLAECLAKLDEPKREMVRLAYLDGWTREELSERYGSPVATIKTWLHRSLKQLKDCMRP